MHVVSGISKGLPKGVHSKIGIYRHNVFVEQLGWKLRTQDGEELDQFDRPDTDMGYRRHTRYGLVSISLAATTAATGLTYFAIRFLRRPPICRQIEASLPMGLIDVPCA